MVKNHPSVKFFSFFPSLVSDWYSLYLRRIPHVSKPYVNTRFCTHNLVLENDWNDPLQIPKNHSCITCIKSFIAHHKNDLEILMVVMVRPIPKSNCRIERYHKIKFSRSTCIVWGWNRSRVINWNCTRIGPLNSPSSGLSPIAHHMTVLIFGP